MDINFYVQSDRLTSDIKQPISGNVNFYRCVFTFSEEWDITAKYAVFSRSGKTYTVELKENACFIPAEVLTESGYITIGVFGTNGSESDYLRISSNAATVYVGTGAYEDGETPAPPTPDVWEEIKAELDNLSQKSEETDKRISEAEADVNELTEDMTKVKQEYAQKKNVINCNVNNSIYQLGYEAKQEVENGMVIDFTSTESYNEGTVTQPIYPGKSISAKRDENGNIIHKTYAEKANAITKKLKYSDEVDLSPVTYSFNGNALMFGNKNTDNMPVNIASMAIRDDLYNIIRETYATKDELKSAVDGIDLSDCVTFEEVSETEIDKLYGGNSVDYTTTEKDELRAFEPKCYRVREDFSIIIAHSVLQYHPVPIGVYGLNVRQVRIYPGKYGTYYRSGGASFNSMTIDPEALEWEDWICNEDEIIAQARSDCASKNDLENLQIQAEAAQNAFYYGDANVTPSPISDFEYTVGDEYVTITKYIGSDTEVVVPHTIEDKEVREIGSMAFMDNANVTNIVLPNCVKTIGMEAFHWCYSLEYVNIPDGVTKLDYYLFSGCSKLAKIAIPNSVTHIDLDCFFGCRSLTHVDIPNGVKTIEGMAFAECEKLTTVKLPSSVSEINSICFSSSDTLTIYVEQGSYAEEYCKTQGLKYKYTEVEADVYATKSELSESEATAADTYAKKSDMGITMEYVSGTDTKYYLSQGSAYYVYNGSKVQFYDYDGNKLNDIDGNTISSSKAFLFVMPANYADGNLKLYRNLAGWKTTLGTFESCNTDTYLDKPCYFKLVSGGPAMVYKLKFSE